MLGSIVVPFGSRSYGRLVRRRLRVTGLHQPVGVLPAQPHRTRSLRRRRPHPAHVVEAAELFRPRRIEGDEVKAADRLAAAVRASLLPLHIAADEMEPVHVPLRFAHHPDVEQDRRERAPPLLLEQRARGLVQAVAGGARLPPPQERQRSPVGREHAGVVRAGLDGHLVGPEGVDHPRCPPDHGRRAVRGVVTSEVQRRERESLCARRLGQRSEVPVDAGVAVEQHDRIPALHEVARHPYLHRARELHRRVGQAPSGSPRRGRSRCRPAAAPPPAGPRCARARGRRGSAR